MKRLFLASSGLYYIKEFVGRDPSEVKMLFIPTAGNLDENVWWIDKDRDVLSKMGFVITELDIANSSFEDAQIQLSRTDIVYIAGGNTFYLLKQLQDTGFSELLKDYIENGGLYAGASAGALVAGLDIEPVSSIDEPEKVDRLKSTKGLSLVNIVPIPHYDMASRSKLIDKIKVKYSGKFELVLLTDDEAIVVEGDTWTKVRSERSSLEHEWFKRNHDDLV
jgi:dipeptidase E